MKTVDVSNFLALSINLVCHPARQTSSETGCTMKGNRLGCKGRDGGEFFPFGAEFVCELNRFS